jgi:GMP synthase-like glutamine amidotransferase
VFDHLGPGDVSLRILIVQHSAADSPAAVRPILDQLGHHVSTVRLDRGDPIPQEADCDVLMMFGGGISLTASDLPPWVEPERRLIRKYVDSGRRLLGICLGSQLLASALGATVQRNPEPEVGWHRVLRVVASPRDRVAGGLPDQMTVFQWHQDTFGIPNGATQLYRSDACRNQAFVIDDRVFGFQFHFEANERTVQTFLAVSKLWRRQATYVQTEAQIIEGVESYLATQNEQLKAFLTALCPQDTVLKTRGRR